MDRFLTKSRATWILSGILLMAALNRQDSFVYAMFLGVTAMGALGYLLPWLALRSSTLERTGQWLQETQLDEDRALDLGLRLRQSRWWPAWVVEVEARWEWSGREFLSRSTIATSRRGSAVPVLDNIMFRCRGHYHLRELRLRSGFPLGLVHAQRVLQVEQFAVVVRPAQSPVVLPATWSASPDILGDDCQGHAGDSLELNSLRPYEPGHAVRNVDWRASARAGDLITRQYQRPASILVKLAIDPRPLSKQARWGLGIAAVLMGVLVLPHTGSFYVYEKHFRDSTAEMKLQFGDLSSRMDERAVKDLFPASSLRCMAHTQNNLGDRVCYAAPRRVNGTPSLTLAFFFRKDRLTIALVHVPWWAHGRARADLERLWARPKRAGIDETGKTLVGWTLPDGHIEMNDNRYLSPLAWSVVMWRAASE